MKTGWLAFELQDYREHPEPSTYTLFSYEELPPIQAKFDEEFRWLESEPIKDGSLAEFTHSDGSRPDLRKLSKITEQIDITLPHSFERFISSLDLHRKIRSCTDCYLDVADRAVRTKGTEDGYLIHFLSDSQWCFHWYLHVSHSGEHFVAVSFDAYGFDIEDAEIEDEDPEIDFYATCRKDEIELEREEIWYCSPTFTEFIYRFWLENEIWFSIAYEERPLTREQGAYVEHYRKPNAGALSW